MWDRTAGPPSSTVENNRAAAHMRPMDRGVGTTETAQKLPDGFHLYRPTCNSMPAVRSSHAPESAAADAKQCRFPLSSFPETHDGNENCRAAAQSSPSPMKIEDTSIRS